MVVGHEDDVKGKIYEGENVHGVLKKSLIGPKDGWDGWVMRIFHLDKGGYTPRHSHDWPHINYIVSGRGIIYLDGKENAVKKGSYAYIPGGVMHQFRNEGEDELSFICIVPENGDV